MERAKRERGCQNSAGVTAMSNLVDMVQQLQKEREQKEKTA
jgi:hypothetical protein